VSAFRQALAAAVAPEERFVQMLGSAAVRTVRRLGRAREHAIGFRIFRVDDAVCADDRAMLCRILPARMLRLRVS
jgi:hypothetical protein